MSTKKYRISLTASQISFILATLRNTDSSEAYEIYNAMNLAMYKISNGMKSADVVTTGTSGRRNIIGNEELGFSSSSHLGNVGDTNNSMNNADDKCLAHYKYISTPELCTVQEINKAKEYMYVNGLMSKEEIQEYEKETGVFDFPSSLVNTPEPS